MREIQILWKCSLFATLTLGPDSNKNAWRMLAEMTSGRVKDTERLMYKSGLPT